MACDKDKYIYDDIYNEFFSPMLTESDTTPLFSYLNNVFNSTIAFNKDSVISNIINVWGNFAQIDDVFRRFDDFARKSTTTLKSDIYFLQPFNSIPGGCEIGLERDLNNDELYKATIGLLLNTLGENEIGIATNVNTNMSWTSIMLLRREYYGITFLGFSSDPSSNVWDLPLQNKTITTQIMLRNTGFLNKTQDRFFSYNNVYSGHLYQNNSVVYGIGSGNLCAKNMASKFYVSNRKVSIIPEIGKILRNEIKHPLQSMWGLRCCKCYNSTFPVNGESFDFSFQKACDTANLTWNYGTPSSTCANNVANIYCKDPKMSQNKYCACYPSYKLSGTDSLIESALQSIDNKLPRLCYATDCQSGIAFKDPNISYNSTCPNLCLGIINNNAEYGSDIEINNQTINLNCGGDNKGTLVVSGVCSPGCQSDEKCVNNVCVKKEPGEEPEPEPEKVESGFTTTEKIIIASVSIIFLLLLIGISYGIYISIK